jgi:peptidoglycan biosynthesis protein MviN/MurJ (putative lipid II flippase)
MKVSLLAIALNFVLNSLLVSSFGFKGLALSTSVLVSCNAFFLYRGLKRKNLFIQGKSLLRLCYYIGIGVVAAYLGYLFLQEFLGEFLKVSSYVKANYILSFTCYLLWVTGVFLILLSKFYDKSFSDLMIYFKDSK